jgi:hypothetical protein
MCGVPTCSDACAERARTDPSGRHRTYGCASCAVFQRLNTADDAGTIATAVGHTSYCVPVTCNSCSGSRALDARGSLKGALPSSAPLLETREHPNSHLTATVKAACLAEY